MDGISALGVAVAVTAFLDFGYKVVTKSFEIRKTTTDAPLEVVNLAASADTLTSVASEARKGIANLGSSYSTHEKALNSLIAECTSVETKLKSAMDKFRVNTSSKLLKQVSTVKVAVRSVWSEKEFQELNKQMQAIRNQISFIVLMCVWGEAKKTSEQTTSINKGVGHIIEIMSHIDVAMSAMKDEFKQLAEGRLASGVSKKEKVDDAIWASTGLVDLKDSSVLPPPYSATETGTRATKAEMTKKILDSLKFDGMDDRGNRIMTPFPKTFEWLFADDSGDQSEGKQRSSFPQWLRQQKSELFWITGVPASGKSTLMKYISKHDSLRSCLRDWAGKANLYIATFYFWGPGSKFQRSRNGLLRSLLHQLLSQAPELAEAVAPRRRYFHDLAGLEIQSPSWEWNELRECFFRFVSHIQSSNSRLALFIDGLDEYDGDREELLAFLTDIQKYQAKLCVSSRPWKEFADAFHQNPSLTMEQLTKSDIDLYVEKHLGEFPAILEIRDAYSEEVTRLIVDLKTQAKGVFLWVVLVVEQLRITSRENPDFREIRRVFNDLPDDLEDLYKSIQKQIGAEKEPNASKLYQLIMEWKRTWSGQIEATFLWLSIRFKDLKEQEPYPKPDSEKHLPKVIARYLEGHTRGILQISDHGESTGPPTVDFLHRTAFDWLQTEENMSQLCSKGPQGYQPILVLLAVLVGHIQSLDATGNYTLRRQCISRIFMLAGEVPNTAEARAQLVPILDKLDSRHLQALRIDDLFLRTGVSTKNRKVDMNVATWAAAWGCHAYLCHKLDADPSIIKTQRANILFLSRVRQSAYISLLEAAIFGFSQSTVRNKSKPDPWFIEVRRLSPWQASQRLDTVKVLLEKGIRVQSSVKESLRQLRDQASDGSVEFKYAQLLLEMVKHHNALSNFKEIKGKFLSESMIRNSRAELEYPEYQIVT